MNPFSSMNSIRMIILILGTLYHILDSFSFLFELKKSLGLFMLAVNLTYLMRSCLKIVKISGEMIRNREKSKSTINVLIDYKNISGTRTVIRNIGKVAKTFAIGHHLLTGHGPFYHSLGYNMVSIVGEVFEIGVKIRNTVLQKKDVKVRTKLKSLTYNYSN